MNRQVVFLVAVSVLIGTGTAYGFNPNTDASLVGWWPLNDETGTVAVDASGNNHDGTLTNGPTWVAGYLGGALNFDGTDDYVDTGLTTNLPTWTICCWVNSPAAPSGTGSPSGPLHREANYQIDWNHSGGWAGYIGANIDGSWWGVSLGPLQANTWYHLCGTYDGAEMRAYTNGVLITASAKAGTPVAESNSLKLGKHAASAQYYGGIVDDARVYDRALTEEEIQAVMTGGIDPSLASDPSPKDEATDVSRDTVLSWTPGEFAVTHDVYIGTSFADVNNAERDDDPLGLLVSKDYGTTTYDPTRFDLGQTYYWRIDEVNAPSTGTIYKGGVWTFTVEPVSFRIAGSRITASASSVGKPDWGPEKTIDGSGLNANDQHSTAATDMWVTATGPAPVWIMYAFDQPYVLDKMMVWNSNQTTETALGVGAKDVTIDYSMDGEDWTPLGDFVFNKATAKPTYTANTEVSFGSITTRYVKITINSNWGNKLKTFSLSEVRFFSIPVAARLPVPASGATGVNPQVTLSWRSGRQAASHQVYLNTDQQAVTDSTVAAITTAQPSHDATVDLVQTYYWKVIEVNGVESPSAWPSEVWSFTTADYVVVEDFERYGNDSPNRVFQTWIDGGGFSADEFFPNGNLGNGTGSLVGYDPLVRNIMETTAVHGGAKSAPFFYSNTAAVPTSETTRTFDAPQDWTASAIKTLTLYFYGDPNNTGSDPLWVKLGEGTKSSAKVTFGAAAGEILTSLVEPAWTEWNMPLSSFTGVDLAKITSITIGMGPGTAAGQLFLDDIRLYPARTTVVPPAGVLVGHWKLDNNAQDSSGNGNDGTLNGGPTYEAAGKIGAALSLDGIDDYVDCGNGASLDITGTITVAAWINPIDVGNAEHNDFVGKGDESYALKHNSGNFIEFFVYGDGTWYSARTAELTTALNNTWHHVAGTYDGAQVKLYIDGTLVGSRLYVGAVPTTTYNVNIGRNSQQTDRLYRGLIDDVRIYQGVLSSSEIATLANP